MPASAAMFASTTIMAANCLGATVIFINLLHRVDDASAPGLATDLSVAICAGMWRAVWDDVLHGTMTQSGKTELSEEQSISIVARVREELARRRLSRQYLADAAKISISTLEKALSGHRPLTLATTIRLEEALGISLRTRKAESADDRSAVAAYELGSYAHGAVTWIEGSYLTLRPSFGEQGAIFAYLTEIRWDDERTSLVFQEAERFDADFTQQGLVSIPNQSGHFYLVTNQDGQYRLIILARPTIGGQMYGLLATLRVGQGAQLTPVAAAIAFVPLERLSDVVFGRIPTSHRQFAPYRKILDRVTTDSFANFMPW